MVLLLLLDSEELESDRAIKYSEELQVSYSPSSPSYWPLSPITWPLSPSYWPLSPITWPLSPTTWPLSPTTWPLSPRPCPPSPPRPSPSFYPQLRCDLYIRRGNYNILSENQLESAFSLGYRMNNHVHITYGFQDSGIPTAIFPSPLPFPQSPRPSSSHSNDLYICQGNYFFWPQVEVVPNLNIVLIAEYKFQDRGSAFDVIPSGFFIRINKLVKKFGHIVDSSAKNMVSLIEQLEDWDRDHVYDIIEGHAGMTKWYIDSNSEDVLVVDQYLIQYRGDYLEKIPGGNILRLNGCEIVRGQIWTSTPEAALVFLAKVSLRLYKEHGSSRALISFGWNWLHTFNITEPLWSNFEIRFWGVNGMFDYPLARFFEIRGEPTTTTRKEIQMLQLPPTVQQENPNEDFELGCSDATGNGGVEAVGIRGEGTEEDEIAEAQLHTGCFGKRKRSPREERGNKKTTRVRKEISLEEILQIKDLHLEDAARHLNVSKSTLKRVCRQYNISRWPPRDELHIGQSCPNESPAIVDQGRILQLNSDMPLPPNQVSATIDTHSVTVRAHYEDLRIKFRLSWPWRKVELEQEVKKRLQLEAATYYIKYKDDVDGGLILIGCDEDLKDCISSSSPLGTHSIEVFLSRRVAHEVRVDQL